LAIFVIFIFKKRFNLFLR